MFFVVNRPKLQFWYDTETEHLAETVAETETLKKQFQDVISWVSAETETWPIPAVSAETVAET